LKNKKISADQTGAVLITFAILLTVLIGFTALGVEAGKWYLVKAELAKAVDAAALAGAKNISNPQLQSNGDLEALIKDFGRENFSDSYLGTTSMSMSVEFPDDDSGRVEVTGSTVSPSILAQLFGVDEVTVGNFGAATKRNVEIMMVLDRSGSMNYGSAMSNLKIAAKNFLDYFEDTQDLDRAGLISFSMAATVDFSLQENFVDSMKAKINAMKASGYTNAEDGIGQSDGPDGFTDQTDVLASNRVQQFLIFFTDGNPNAFRSNFTRLGKDYDAVVYEASAYGNGTGKVCGGGALCNPVTGNSLSVPPLPTGDGLIASLSACGTKTTRWWVFEDPDYPVTGYTSPYCNLPDGLSPNVLRSYVSDTARQMAINHAAALKAKDVTIYVIALGSETTGQIRKDFLEQIASSPSTEYYYQTPDSSELNAIFNTIAKEIKLRLVE